MTAPTTPEPAPGAVPPSWADETPADRRALDEQMRQQTREDWRSH